jgi:hypothetical protein
LAPPSFVSALLALSRADFESASSFLATRHGEGREPQRLGGLIDRPIDRYPLFYHNFSLPA